MFKIKRRPRFLLISPVSDDVFVFIDNHVFLRHIHAHNSRSQLSVKASSVMGKFMSTFKFLVLFNKIFKAIRQMS